VVIESCCLAMEARTQVILWEYLKTGSETDTALSPLRCHCINEKRCPGVTYYTVRLLAAPLRCSINRSSSSAWLLGGRSPSGG